MLSLAILGIGFVALRGGPLVAAPVGCTAQPASPALIVLGSPPGGLVFDSDCQFLYVTNPLKNRVEVFSLQTLSLEEPIQVGAQPSGLDTSVDGTQLYIANGGSNNVSVVNLARREEARKIAMPYSTNHNDRPYSIVVMGNGKAFYTTRETGSTGGRLLELVLATEQSAARNDVQPNGLGGPVYLRRSSDRVTFAVAQSQWLQLYRTSTNAFSAPKNTFFSDIALNQSASILLVNQGSLVFDAALNQIGTIAGGNSISGVAVNSAGTLGYRSVSTRVEFLNLITFLETGEVELGASTLGNSAYGPPGQIAISEDGKLIAVTTVNGFAVVRPPGTEPAPAAVDRIMR
jgi:YVTN family beta-propeller protein